MKTYFTEIDEVISRTKNDILQQMQEQRLTEIKAWEAISVYDTGHFYCKEHMQVGIVGEGCGNQCKDYEPRNGKNGRCRHSGGVYEKGKEGTFKL